MARTRGRRSRRQRVRTARNRAVAGAVLLACLLLFWSEVWPYLLVVAVAVGLGALVRWLWKTDRLHRLGDRAWRRQDARQAALRSLTSADIDAMSGTRFEDLVADLCRRDGCREIQRVGGSRDNGVDITGRLPDGRRMVVQCKRYAPHSAVSSGAVRDLMGARIYAGAEVAVLVTTARFSRPAQETARAGDVVAIHRDLLGHWHHGTPLTALAGLRGAGQGDLRHLRRWKRTYGKQKRPAG
ncbi:restriction endonuclease [Streptomyces sp. ACA25]|uniref:restriction endonuclease n=1 Tax=Streptomyces sp. ACA25 TaxID=3022596 RepID=UPI0023077F25|nr:restriction endonuclease [Streptomyces sp. ACA25]MDB1086121.1 restriction endonuclease [Streptomyces sp. ACA25]